jgi:VWFA-related protein
MRTPDSRTRCRAPYWLIASGIASLTLAAAPALLAQAADQSQYTIRARVPLTIVDVIVTDSQGHPVHGLKQSDFAVLEDNQPVTPNSFEEHRSDTAPTTSIPAQPSILPNTFTNVSVATTAIDRPLNLLLIDSLNTPMAAQVQTRRRTLEFLDRLPAGTRIEVLALSQKLSVVQGLTDNRERLKAAVNSLPIQLPRWEDPGQEPPGVDPPSPLEVEGANVALRSQLLTTSMQQIARYLSGLPGRKNLLWFSGAEPQQFPPQPADPDIWPPYVIFDGAAELKSATDALARAHVAVYPIDSRILERINPLTRKGTMQLAEHDSMDITADQTGGKAFYNTNGLAEAAAEAIDTGANFYTLTYTPTNQSLDAHFRTIAVKVNQPNLRLTYRNGYYAVDPATTLSGKQVNKTTPLQSALMRGSLEPTQILFKIRVAQSPTTDAAISTDNLPNPKLMHPPYRHYSISYLINIHGIDFTPSADANYRGGFEYGVRVYNTEGDEILNSVSKTVTPILTPAVYKSMLTGGANAHQEIDLPATGNYVLRIAVHDLTTNHIGAIEVPTTSIAPNPTLPTR